MFNHGVHLVFYTLLLHFVLVFVKKMMTASDVVYLKLDLTPEDLMIYLLHFRAERVFGIVTVR